MRASRRQFSFTHGEVSPSVYGRADMEFYFAALQECVNFIPDHKGRLHRRPGTQYLNNTRGNAPAKLYPFVFDREQSYMIEATPGFFRFYSDRGVVVDGGVPVEVATPYFDPDYCELEFVQSGDTLWIVHENHAPRMLTRTGPNSFALNIYSSEGPFSDLNRDEDCKICIGAGGSGGETETGLWTVAADTYNVGDTVDIDLDGGGVLTLTITADNGGGQYEVSFPPTVVETGDYDVLDGLGSPTGEVGTLAVTGAQITAQGCEPFTEDMIGLQIRILDEVGDDPDNPENVWRVLTITDFINGSTVVTDWSGGALPCTDLWQMSEFRPGNYPETVWIHQDRLYFGNTPANATGVWGSAVGDFFSFAPSDPDGSVNPDNAVYADINNGQRDEVRWLWSWGRNLLVGTQTGIHTLYGTGVNGAIQPDAFGQALSQSIGVSDRRPVQVGDSVYFIDRARRKLYATGFTEQYDHVGLEELTIFADHIGDCRFDRIAWEENPYSIVWARTDDGHLSSLTAHNVQRVRGWARHRLGGHYLSGGCLRAPFVEDLEVIPGPSEADDDVYLVVKRTIDGETVRFVEVIQDFFICDCCDSCDKGCGTPEEHAWFLDAALRYGTPGASNTVARVDPGSPSVELDPVPPGASIAIFDEHRWHVGDVVNREWRPRRPNRHGDLKPCPGVDWYLDRDVWRPLELPAWGEEPEYVAPCDGWWRPPCSGSVSYSALVSSLQGYGHLSGAEVRAFVNGGDYGNVSPDAGVVAVDDPAYVALVGFPYESRARLLPFRMNLGSTDGMHDPRYVPRVTFDLQCSRGLEAGMGRLVRSRATWCEFHPVAEDFDEALPEGPMRLSSGWREVPTVSGGTQDRGSDVAWRNRTPFPTIIRNIEALIYASGGK